MSATIGRLCSTSPSEETRTSSMFSGRLPPACASIKSERQDRVRLGGQDHAFELALDARQRGRRLRFEAHHDHRRGVRRTRQAEAVLVFDAQAVDGDDLLVAGEGGVAAQLVHQGDVLALLQFQVQLGRAVRLRQGVQQLRRIGFLRQDFEQARAGVHAVVEAVPAVLEEDMAAHFAPQRGAGFAQLGLDQRVAGLVHQRLAAMLGDPRRQVARAFDVVQYLFDVKCTRHLAPWIAKHGGQPLMYKTGHSLVKAKLRETGAPLGGEMSGHIFFKDRWYGFDDGMYAGARLLEILTKEADPSKLLNSLPQSDSTPELHLELKEGENVALMDKLRSDATFPGHQQIITIDGLRVEYEDGFGLARSSNTTPVIVMRFEAETPAALARIQGQFKSVILAAKPDAVLPF